MRGNTLRTEIYNSLSHHKLANTTRLLRHTLKSQLRQSDYQSEASEMKTEMCSPALKTENSLQKMSKSVNDSWASRRDKLKSGSKSKEKIMGKDNSKKEGKAEKTKSKSEMLTKTKLRTVDKGKTGHKKGESKDRQKNKSTAKECKKINLESII
jgi:hypothetical protein